MLRFAGMLPIDATALKQLTMIPPAGRQGYRVYAEPDRLPPRSTCALRCGDASLGKLVGGGANGGRAPATQFRAFEDVGCQADLVAASAAVSVQACENAVDFHLHLDVPG